MSKSLLTEEESGAFSFALLFGLVGWMWHKGALSPDSTVTEAKRETVRKGYESNGCDKLDAAACHVWDGRSDFEKGVDSVVQAIKENYWDAMHTIIELKEDAGDFIDAVGEFLGSLF